MKYCSQYRLMNEFRYIKQEIDLLEKNDNIKIFFEQNIENIQLFTFNFRTLKDNDVTLHYDCTNGYPFLAPKIKIDYNKKFNNGLKYSIKCLFEEWSPALTIYKHMLTILAYINTYEEEKHREIILKNMKHVEYLGNKFNVPEDIINIIENKICSL